MCALAKGIVKGAAKAYGERVAISESTCMLRGDEACSIRVTLAS
jgi:predicted hydrocarbon binding protein